MPLVNYEGGDSSDDDNEESNEPIVIKSRTEPTKFDETSLLSKLPKPIGSSTEQSQRTTTEDEYPEDELEDIVRAENKTYAKNLPESSKPIKRKRDGPVKIFLPSMEQDSDDEDKPKKKVQLSKKGCVLLSTLPPPVHDEDSPLAPLVEIKPPTEKTPQVSATGLFIPYTVNRKKANIKVTKNEDDEDDDDDDEEQADFLGLNKSDQVQVSSSDVESVLRETFPKARVPPPAKVVVQEPTRSYDLDEQEHADQQSMHNDEEELLKYLPKSERYKEIKSVHIDSMMSETARLQLLKNCSEEREAMKKQASVHVPKGEVRKRGQMTYLIAKAQSEDLKLNNMWSEQKLTKKQTQAKYGF